jgi:hypothetical protein
MASDGDQPHHRPNGGVRARLLQEELDRRVAALSKEIDLRLAAVEAMRAYLVAELDRRFTDARRETGQQFASTIAMRIALQDEMDRRFAELSGQLDRRFTDSERAVQAALTAAKEAVDRANDASNKRFDAVNEFRGQLTDQARNFMSRNEFAAQHASLVDTVGQLRQDLTRVDGMVVPRAENESWRTQITDKISESSKTTAERLSEIDKRLTSRMDLVSGRSTGEDSARAEARDYETLSFAKRQAMAVSPSRNAILAVGSVIVVLISVISLILTLTGKK